MSEWHGIKPKHEGSALTVWEMDNFIYYHRVKVVAFEHSYTHTRLNIRHCYTWPRIKKGASPYTYLYNLDLVKSFNYARGGSLEQ